MSQGPNLRGAAFPSTHWSLLLAGRDSSTQARAALEDLAAKYWRPVAAYVRARWARSDDEALDATQEFFLWILEGDLLARADPSRGRFRSFLRTAAGHFVQDLERKRRTVKRGGGRQFLSLDPQREGDSSTLELSDPAGRRPDQLLDELWRAELVQQATETLQAELEAAGKGHVFAVFRDYFLGDEELDYAAVAARHGVSKVDVSNHLAYAKQRYRLHLRRAVLPTVGSDGDLEQELAWLFGGQAG